MRTVNVVCPPCVVAGHDSIESRHALFVGELDSAQSGGVDQRQVVRVAVARVVENTPINALEAVSNM